MTQTIRRARRDEVAAIVAFQIAMAEETESLRLDPQVVRAGVEAVFDDTGIGGEYWVTADGDQLVASLLALSEWSDWRNGKVLWIHSVYVLPAYRGQALFKRMYKHLQQLVAADTNLKGLRLYVDKRNEAAQAVYRSLGMNGDHYLVYEWMP